MANNDYGIPGFDPQKGGAIARARAELSNSARGDMTKAEYEGMLRRKKLEDEAEARRQAAANQGKKSAASDLMGKIFGQ